MLLLAFLACVPDTADVSLGERPACGEGFERHDDGACYEIDAGDTDTDTDTDTGHDTDTDTDTGTLPPEDADADGYPVGEDCDDTNDRVYPDALELCDELDNDCDLAIDEGVQTRYFVDADADGFGDADGESVMACDVPPGHANYDDDCDDTDPSIHPGAPDDGDEGLDNDCDGVADEDYDACAEPSGSLEWAPSTWYPYEEYDLSGFRLRGRGVVCSITCWDEEWVGVADLAEDPGFTRPVTLPVTVTDSLSVGLYVYAPDAGPKTTSVCEAYTSAGTIDLVVTWIGE